MVEASEQAGAQLGNEERESSSDGRLAHARPFHATGVSTVQVRAHILLGPSLAAAIGPALFCSLRAGPLLLFVIPSLSLVVQL